MISIKKLSVTSFVLIAGAYNLASAQKLTDKIPLDAKVKKGKLANGLTYYIRRNVKPEGKVELHLAVNAGSVLERDDQQGVAHFLEHMAFNGTKNFPKNKLTDYLEKSGVRFGADLNAHTSFDETVYDLPISSSDPKILDSGYQVIRDWAGNLLLDVEEIDKERGIILEEKRMRQGAGMRMVAQYFPKLLNGSIYGKRLPIGTEQVIKTAKRSVFADFYRDWYRPNNMAVIVVGDIDVVAAEAKVKKLFGDLKNPANAPIHPERMPVTWHTTNKSMVVTDKENTNNMVQIYLGLTKNTINNTWQEYQEQVLNNLISSLIGSRLREYQLKASSAIGFGSISFNSQAFRGYKVNTISGGVKEDPAAAINTLVGEVLRAKQFGFTQAEFDRVKKQVLENLEERLLEKDKTESDEFAGEYINNFLEKEPAPGIEAEHAFTENFFNTLTLQQVNAAIAKFDFNAPAFVLFMVNSDFKKLPSEADLLAAYDAAKKQKVEAYTEKVVAKNLMDILPTPGKIVSTNDNTDFNAKTLMLSNGIKVIYKKTDFKNDEILVSGYQWGGNSLLSDIETKHSMYLSLFGRLGVGKHTSSDLQKMMKGVNARAGFSVGETELNVNGSSNIKDFEKMMQLLHLKFTDINFDKDEMEGIRSTFKQQLAFIKSNPEFKFSDSFNRYRHNFSKRVQSIPDAAELDAINFEDIKAVYKKITSNLNGLTLVFVGNVDETILKKMVELYVASIPTQVTKPAVNTANMLHPITGKNNFVMKGGKENKSQIEIEYYGDIAAWDDKENMAFGLMAEVLQMKTTDKLREEMGGTYSPRVDGNMNRAPDSDFSLNLSVSAAPENVEKLSAAFAELINKIANGDVTDDDMKKAVEQRKKLMETQFKTNGYWASAISRQDMYNYDPKLTTNYFARLAEIKKEDLVAAAKKYLLSANVLSAVLNPEKSEK